MMTEKYRGVANPELHSAMHGLRSSSAAQPHADRRTKRLKTRLNQKKNAIAEFRGSVLLCSSM